MDESQDDKPKLVHRSAFSRSAKLCPRCLSPLERGSSLGGWMIPQDYFCAKCGYEGYAYLEAAQGKAEGEKA